MKHPTPFYKPTTCTTAEQERKNKIEGNSNHKNNLEKLDQED